MMRISLIPLLFLAGSACQNGASVGEPEMRIEIAYEENTVFGKSEGEDGEIERSMLLRDQLFVLEQRGRRLEFDMRDFAGDVFIAHQSRLTLPLSFQFPDGTRMTWTRGRVQVGEHSVREPKRGSYRWDPELGAFTSLESGT